MAASIIEDLMRSIQLLSGIPNQEARLSTIQSFNKELEVQLLPKLESALQSRNDTQQLLIHKIYCHLGLESKFIEEFCHFHSASFVQYCFFCFIHSFRVWKNSQAESVTDSIQNFYTNLHTWLLSLSDDLISIFSDNDDSFSVSPL